MDPADFTWPSISGDHVKYVTFYTDVPPPNLWKRIKHHFLHFGEEYPQFTVHLVEPK